MIKKLKGMKDIFTWNYTILTLGNATSSLGSIIYKIILAWWIVQETNSAKMLGIITAAGTLPVVIFNLFSGVIVDRKNRKLILVFSDIVSGLACIMISYLAYDNIISIPLIVIASFILGASSSLFSPAIRAILPELVKKDHISKCNSMTSSITSVLKIVGPVLAGILMNNFSLGIAGAFFLNGISFIVSAISELFLKYDATKKEMRNSYIEDLKAGFIYLKDYLWLTYLLLGAAAVNIFLAAYNILLPLFVKTYYINDTIVYSQALTSAAIGGILGGLSITASKKGSVTFKKLGLQTVLQGVFFTAIQITIHPYIMLLSILLFIFYLTRFNIMFFSLVQLHVDKEMLGRVFSFIFMVALATVPVANLLYGFLGEYMLNYVYLLSGGGIIISSLLQFRAEKHFKITKHEIPVKKDI